MTKVTVLARNRTVLSHLAELSACLCYFILSSFALLSLNSNESEVIFLFQKSHGSACGEMT